MERTITFHHIVVRTIYATGEYKHNRATKMSSERDTALRHIESARADLEEVQEELKTASDPSRKQDLETRRALLEDTILTMEKRVLALTGKRYLASFFCSIFILLF